jgi:hypothetical protein
MTKKTNHWLITRDHLENKDTFLKSSHDLHLYPESTFGEIINALPIKFRIFDGDGKLYFSGRMETVDFHPLDEFGIDYGCTELKFYDPNEPMTMTFQQL